MSEVRCHRDHIFYGVLSKRAPGKVLWEAESEALGIISIFISPGSNGAEQPGGRMPNTIPGGLQQACLKDPRPGPHGRAGAARLQQASGSCSFQGPAPESCQMLPWGHRRALQIRGQSDF